MKQYKTYRVRVGPIAKGVLGVVAVAGIIPALAIAPGLAVAMGPFFKKKKYRPQQAINRSVETLVKNGLLKRGVNKRGEDTLMLTKRGKWEAGIRNLADVSASQNEKWDGMWRVIVFDIPNHKGNIRHELRHAATCYGFLQLQKSVWVYPYPCDDFVKLVKNHLDISNDVLYMIATYIENDRHLRHDFHLH